MSSSNTKRNVLAEIVEYKREVVAERKANKPLDSFINTLQPSDRSLKRALSNEQSDFILECKKASPSKGLIRKDFVLSEILNEYKDYASAISILTDEKYFQGDLNFISEATITVKQPILCKDFFIEPYQVYEARAFGADAILLMLSVLDDETYTELAQIADSLNLDVLTEVHDKIELERAVKLEAKIIGINNRDLRDLSIDLATTEALAPQAKSLNPNAIIISESGIETHSDVERLSSQVDGFLIGSSIMAKRNIRHHCKSLLFGNVKICGLTKQEDAIAIDKHGGNYGGLIFYPPSSRFITLDTARSIVSSAPLRFIGVFVDEEISIMVDTAKSLNLFAIQLHGKETEEDILELRETLNSQGLKSTHIWKAVHVTDSVAFAKDDNVDRYLLDKFDPVNYGGTGATFDWSVLNGLNTDELILAGGINLNNVKQLEQFSHYAIDLSSGVESEPGKKCIVKIENLFCRLRA